MSDIYSYSGYRNAGGFEVRHGLVCGCGHRDVDHSPRFGCMQVRCFCTDRTRSIAPVPAGSR